jgi:hypothetical protein
VSLFGIALYTLARDRLRPTEATRNRADRQKTAITQAVVMREWNTAFELYVIAPWGRCTSEAVIYSAAGQAAEVGRVRPVQTDSTRLHP